MNEWRVAGFVDEERGGAPGGASRARDLVAALRRAHEEGDTLSFGVAMGQLELLIDHLGGP